FTRDTFTSHELGIDFLGRERLRDVQRIARHGALMAISSGREVSLYSLRDSAIPVLLSKVDAGAAVSHLALGERYLAVTSGSRADTQIFDIANVYAPLSINRLHNVYAYDVHQLVLAGEHIYQRVD